MKIVFMGTPDYAAVTLEKLMELLCINPLKRFGVEKNEDFSVWSLDEEYEMLLIDGTYFCSFEMRENDVYLFMLEKM